MRLVRWLLNGYDFPLHRDWLAWVGVVVVVMGVGIRVSRGGPWGLLGAPLLFAMVGWFGGAARKVVRNRRNPTPAPPMPR
jgi:hypothetical protein